jgi:hypothetical protein
MYTTCIYWGESIGWFQMEKKPMETDTRKGKIKKQKGEIKG